MTRDKKMKPRELSLLEDCKIDVKELYKLIVEGGTDEDEQLGKCGDGNNDDDQCGTCGTEDQLKELLSFIKGGKKGKGKGKAKGGFQGECSYCGVWGHTQRYCFKREREFSEGKGGKGGKGKGDQGKGGNGKGFGSFKGNGKGKGGGFKGGVHANAGELVG